MEEIFIEGNVPSSKNSRVFTGKHFIASKSTREWYSSTENSFRQNLKKFKSMLEGKSKPYIIEFEFIRKSKHKFDYINPAQTIQDAMVKQGYLDDDNADEMIPVFKKYKYDKKNPGVFIRVL